MKLLTIDDAWRLCEALATAIRLNWQNAVVSTATDGEAGLMQFCREQPDVVVLDVTLPRLSGFEVLRQIRRASDVPVLTLTAHDDVDQVRGAGAGRR